jgi:hypothetical protein
MQTDISRWAPVLERFDQILQRQADPEILVGVLKFAQNLLDASSGKLPQFSYSVFVQWVILISQVKRLLEHEDPTVVRGALELLQVAFRGKSPRWNLPVDFDSQLAVLSGGFGTKENGISLSICSRDELPFSENALLHTVSSDYVVGPFLQVHIGFCPCQQRRSGIRRSSPVFIGSDSTAH